MSVEDGIGLRFDSSAVAMDPILRGSRVELPTIAKADGYSEVAISAARKAWEDRTRSEYTGVMIVHHFHGLLVDLNAPMDLQEVALTMLKQEQEHAALCMTAARSLGSDGEVVFDMEELQLMRTSSPLEDQLMGMLVGTYAVGEVVAHRLLRHAIRALPANPYQDILRRIYKDEVLHAHIGPLVINSIRTAEEPRWLPYRGDEQLANEFTKFIQSMRARDVVEEEEIALFEDESLRKELMELGVPPSIPFRNAYFESLNTDVRKSVTKSGLTPEDYPALAQALVGDDTQLAGFSDSCED